MMSRTSPPEQKFPPLEPKTTALMSSACGELAESVAQLGIGIESDRVLSLAALERDNRHVIFATPVEMRGLEILHFHRLGLPRTHAPDKSVELIEMINSASTAPNSTSISSIQPS